MMKNLPPFSLISLIFYLSVLSACADYRSDPYAAFEAGDFDTAKVLLQSKVNQGDLQAITYLAAIYQVEKDYAHAVALYTEAARYNFPPAQYNLAVLLHGGTGVSKNIEHAYGWFNQAAQQGHSKAEDQLTLIMSELTPNQTIKAREYINKQLIKD